MKLLIDNVQKRLDLEELFIQGKWYKKHVWEHGVAYEIAKLYLGILEKNVKRKNRVLRNFLLSAGGTSSKEYLKLQGLMSGHNFIINQFFQEVSKKAEETFYQTNQIFRQTRTLAPFAIYAFELPE